jgi:hypothetical protein
MKHGFVIDVPAVGVTFTLNVLPVPTSAGAVASVTIGRSVASLMRTLFL